MCVTKAHLHNESDNVAIALVALKEGDVAKIKKGEADISIITKAAVPFGHKFAIAEIKPGGDVIKYGGFIGRAVKDISAGEHVHVHNIKGVKYT